MFASKPALSPDTPLYWTSNGWNALPVAASHQVILYNCGAGSTELGTSQYTRALSPALPVWLTAASPLKPPATEVNVPLWVWSILSRVTSPTFPRTGTAHAAIADAARAQM